MSTIFPVLDRCAAHQRFVRAGCGRLPQCRARGRRSRRRSGRSASLAHRSTPATAYSARFKATPGGPGTGALDRVRADIIGDTGTVTLRRGQLYHIGIGRIHARTRVLLLIRDLDVRIINAAIGELLRDLTSTQPATTSPLAEPPDPHRQHPANARNPDPNAQSGVSSISCDITHEVEQVIEPAAMTGCRPNGEAWTASPLPATTTLEPDPGRSGSAVRLAALQPPSLLDTAAALPHVTGSPRPRSTTAAPLRPGPVGAPSPATRAGCTAAGGTGTLPVFTVIRSAKEEPGSAPAASPRLLPRSTSPWSPGLSLNASPEVPRPRRRVRTAPVPYPPGFGPVRVLRDVSNRRFLAYSFPPRSPHPGHLAVPTAPALSGPCHPHRHHPDQAALSFTALLRQGRSRRSLTSTQVTSASRHSRHHRLHDQSGRSAVEI